MQKQKSITSVFYLFRKCFCDRREILHLKCCHEVISSTHQEMGTGRVGRMSLENGHHMLKQERLWHHCWYPSKGIFCIYAGLSLYKRLGSPMGGYAAQWNFRRIWARYVIVLAYHTLI